MDYTLKHLLGKKGSFYKANLNASSSLGSGTLTPEELVKIYKENGYSILSINDEKPVSYNNLSSEDFLCLSGFSFSASEKNGKGVPNKKASFYAISLSEEPNAVSAFDAEYDKEKINEKLSEYKEKNYFITYASPARNIEVLPDHLSYEPYDAFEIINYSSLMDGQDEYSAVAYDNVSRHGKKVFAGGSDSNQNKRPLDDARSDSFGVFAMIATQIIFNIGMNLSVLPVIAAISLAIP